MFLVVSSIVGVGFFAADVVSRTYDLSIFKAEKDHAAPIIRGGQRSGATSSSRSNTKVRAPTVRAAAPSGGLGQVPTGGGAGGIFGDVIDWPIIAVQLSLLPDGRVLSYGTGVDGSQGAVVYDIWDPKKGVGPASHTTLPNWSTTDIFCSAASLISPGFNNATTALSGKIMTVGGDLTVNGVRNYSNADVTVFDPANSSLTKTGNMAYPRWYASMTTRPNGDKLVLGGQRQPGVGEISSELYSPTRGWRVFAPTQFPDAQYSVEWYYPTAALGQDGWFYVLEHGGKILRLTASGGIDMAVWMAQGDYFYPRVRLPVKAGMPAYSMLMVRYDKRVQIVDLANSQPIVYDAAAAKWDRKWGNLTVLANGDVLASGGSGVLNELTNIAYESEIYHPDSDTWVAGAWAQIPRLYHGTSLLLPDGSVLTAGGGAPGPVTNLNAEIYYPPYLYNDDGTPAPRPTIQSAPSSVRAGHLFTIAVGPTDTVSGINLVRLGSSTHSYDSDARLVFAYYIQNGTSVTGYIINDPKIVLPGYYMMFVIDQNGHPSIAKIVSIQPEVVR